MEMMVNAVKVNKESLSSTIAANFQSFSSAAVSSSSLILSVITLSSFSIRLNSLKAPRQKKKIEIRKLLLYKGNNHRIEN